MTFCKNTRTARHSHVALQCFVLLIAFCPNFAVAQAWSCYIPLGLACTSYVGREVNVHPFALKLDYSPTYPAPGHTFFVSGPAVEILNARISEAPPPGMSGPTYVTTTHGIVSGYYRGTVTTPVTITFFALLADGWKEKSLVIRPASTHALDRDPDVKRYWYAGSQVRGGVEVRASNIDEATCRTLVVRYRTIGGVGATTPDSVYGEPDASTGRCVFPAYWRLGDQVGYQHLQATLPGAPPAQFTAVARRKSGLRVSLAGVIRPGGTPNVVESTRKFLVTRIDSVGRTLQYDSMPAVTAIDTSKASLEAVPVVLIDTPIHPRFTGLRALVGASLRDITREFFIGASVLQPFLGVAMEDVGVDVQLAVLISRRARLENAALCTLHLKRDESAPEFNQACDTTETPRIAGLAAMLSVDAAGLISSFQKFLGL